MKLCQKWYIMDFCRTHRWKDIVNIYFLVQTENTALKLPFWKGHHNFLGPSYMNLTENHNKVWSPQLVLNRKNSAPGPRTRRPVIGGRGSRGTPPPPLWQQSWKFTPATSSRTVLHQFAADNKKNVWGACPQTPLTCVSHSLNANYQFKQYFTGVPVTLFWKYPSNPKGDPPPPLQKFLGTGLFKAADPIVDQNMDISADRTAIHENG